MSDCAQQRVPVLIWNPVMSSVYTGGSLLHSWNPERQPSEANWNSERSCSNQ
jgi:hypothetical protein